MTQPLSAAEMRAIEQAAMDRGSVTGLELMERAGQGVVGAILDHWPDLTQGTHRAVVLCGPGNNGGDGFVIARLLKQLGWGVDVFFYGAVDRLPPDALTNLRMVEQLMPVQTLGFPHTTSDEASAFFRAASHLLDDWSGEEDEPKPPFVVFDALFGIGLSRPIALHEHILTHFDYLHLWPDLNEARLVAVDIPSGLDTNTGKAVEGSGAFGVLLAHLTVTFHALKLGHVRGFGPDACGAIKVVDIGL